VKIEIEIPDPPEGWVVDGFRQAEKGERRWAEVSWVECPYKTTGSYLVAVKATPLWEPSPELVAVLKPGWIARDPGRGWYWFKSVPFVNGTVWSGSGYRTLDAIKPHLLPPDTIPWDQCCLKIGDPQE